MSISAKRLIHGLHFYNLKGDIFGGITAAVVALPLALAFGVSSGAGAIAGLYGAIFTGFFAAIFGGTPAQISGPTGPMTVVMATVFTAILASNPENGLAMGFTVVILGGLFQILLGALRLGKYITLIPYAVISGFMSGIGVIIIVIQLGPFLGHAASADVVDSLRQLPNHLSTANPAAAGLGLLTLAIVFGLPRRLNRIVPAPLLALVAGTLASVWLLGDSAVPQIGDIPTGFPTLRWPTFTVGQTKMMLGYGIMLGVLGAIDSLLTSLVADNITQTQHDSDRELIGQGIGNLMSGLFGGLPGAGATMRTVINVKSGGRTPISGMVHALVLLGVVLGAGSLTEPIPHAVLAGILIKVGIDIIDWGFLRRAHRLSLKGSGLMYGVLFLTVFVDLITAVAVGAFIANLLTVKQLSDIQVANMRVLVGGENSLLTPAEQELFNRARGRVLLFHLGGPMSFGAAKAIAQRLCIVGKYEVLILDLTGVPSLGITASLAIETMVKEAYDKQRMVFIVGSEGPVRDRLERLQIRGFPPQALEMTRHQALRHTLEILGEPEPTSSSAHPVAPDSF